MQLVNITDLQPALVLIFIACKRIGMPLRFVDGRGLLFINSKQVKFSTMQPARLYQISGKDDFLLISTLKSSSNDDFEVIENPAERLEFDPAQSHLIGFAINYQSDEKFKARTLGQSVVNDARLISKTFVHVGSLPSSNATVFEAKEIFNNCTFEGMRRCFVQTARSVGKDGLFVFHFSGHGIRFGEDQWGMAPSDFDYTGRNYVTASVLNDWLIEADCKAKHVLFTLDCCYAGGIAEALTSTDIAHRSLFVVSACTANESSYVVGTLGNSVFSYFLSYAMKKSTQETDAVQGTPRFIALQKIFTECQFCSEALSSLLVKYVDGRLHPSGTHPDIQTFGTAVTKPIALEETDSPQVGRFNYVVRHYDRQSPICSLHRVTDMWLDNLRHPEGPLTRLQSRGLLNRKEVLLTALCSLMYSVGSFQLHHSPATVSDVNTFITAYLTVASVIDFHHSGTDFSAFHFLLALSYYIEVLKKNNHPFAPLHGLYATVCRENNQPEDDDAEESVDGPSMVSKELLYRNCYIIIPAALLQFQSWGGYLYQYDAIVQCIYDLCEESVLLSFTGSSHHHVGTSVRRCLYLSLHYCTLNIH